MAIGLPVGTSGARHPLNDCRPPADVLYLPALVAAFLITVLEMTEVVALVFALSLEHGSIRHGASGAVTGTLTVSLIALGSGAALLALPRHWLLWGAAVALAAFGVFLFRSTLKSYRRQRAAATGNVVMPPRRTLLFASGFSIGAIEAIETVIVLLALAAAGYGLEAVLGSLAAGAVLVGATAVVHERIRRIKVPWLKLGATSLLFAFALFWGGEAAGIAWPGSDLLLIPFFLAGVLLVRGAVAAFEARGVPVETKG
jgi:uncharacterized membrane protein